MVDSPEEAIDMAKRRQYSAELKAKVALAGVRGDGRAAMARSFQGRASMGMVHFPRIEWADRVINQLVGFPAGKCDIGGAISGIFVENRAAMSKQRIHNKITGD